MPALHLPKRTRLVDRFTFGLPALFFPRARLGRGFIELTGWRLRGRYRESISIECIYRLDIPRRDQLLLWLADGRTIRLGLSRAPGWKVAIEAQQAARPAVNDPA